jgi:hypothetical protein
LTPTDIRLQKAGMAARSAREATGPRRRCRKRRTPRKPRSPVLATAAVPAPVAWDPADLYMMMPVGCPTCRKMYLAPINALWAYCSAECERLDPRKAPAATPSTERALYHKDVGVPESSWLREVLRPPRLPCE